MKGPPQQKIDGKRKEKDGANLVGLKKKQSNCIKEEIKKNFLKRKKKTIHIRKQNEV